MDKLEDWFDSFSKRLPFFRIELDHIYYDEWDNYAIVGMAVRETSALRALHNQINNELKEAVRDLSAPHDGEEYRFHLTIELGKVGNANPFKRFYESLLEKLTGLSFRAGTIALFFYADRPIGAGSFTWYKVLPLTGSTTLG